VNQIRVEMTVNVPLDLMIILSAVAVISGPVQLANLILTNVQVKNLILVTLERSRSFEASLKAVLIAN